MFSSNYKNISVVCRLKELVSDIHSPSYLLKHYHCRPRTVKCYFGYGKSKSKNKSKALNLIAAAGAGAYACSFMSKRSDPFSEDETGDEFDELFHQESTKEDIQLVTKFGKIPYLLIGSSPAAIRAYRSIRIIDPRAKVLMICEERFNPYNFNFLNELWYNRNSTHPFYDEDYLSVQQMLENKNGGLALIRGKRVVKMDPVFQLVVLDSGEQIAYEKCLLAPGTKPKKLNIFEEAETRIKNRVTLFHSLQDFMKLEEKSKQVKSIAVIGSGLPASELAHGLSEYSKSRNLNVVQIYAEPRILSRVLPEYLSQYVERKFQSRNIHVVPNVTVKAAGEGDDDKVELHLSDGQIVSVDHVAVAVGSEPDTDLASVSGLETDDGCGGFLVNAEMKARNNLWIAGESSSFYDIQFGRHRVEHHEDAVKSGQVAGENMAGLGKPLGYQTEWWSVLAPDMFCQGFGKVDSKLETVGVFVAPSTNTVEGSGNSIAENEDPNNSSAGTLRTKSDDEYRKGIVFYLSNDIVIGILSWNVVADPRVAKKVIEQMKSKDDIVEIAKLIQ